MINSPKPQVEKIQYLRKCITCIKYYIFYTYINIDKIRNLTLLFVSIGQKMCVSKPIFQLIDFHGFI